MSKFCPGSVSIKEPVPETIDCASCGAEVEIWTDELKRRCSNCGHTVYRDRVPSCVDWCQRAEECIGTEAYRRLKGLDE